MTLASGDAAVVGRWVFYNNSVFDGGDPAAGPADDPAVAPDKQALRPGEAAGFEHYTSYERGINGVMVDILGLPGEPTADDFVVRVGNDADPANWPLVGTAPTVSVRPDAGSAGSDRVTLTFPDGQIADQWLAVTVKATTRTGLAADETFYFGNARGETGNAVGDATVDEADLIAAAGQVRDALTPASATDRYDINRDGLVNVRDLLAIRQRADGVDPPLALFTAPGATTAAFSFAAPNLFTLDAGQIQPVAEPEPGGPAAQLTDVEVTLTDLPAVLGSLTLQLAPVDAYDDNGDGDLDGVGFSGSLALGDVDLELGGLRVVRLESLTLALEGIEIRPELGAAGLRAGDIRFDASGAQVLPDGVAGLSGFGLGGGSGSADGDLALPGIGGVNLQSGAFTLDLDVPAGVSRWLSFNGIVPLRLTQLSAEHAPGEALGFGVEGVPDLAWVTEKLGELTNSPELAIGLEVFSPDTGAFAPVDEATPLPFGLTHAGGELRPVETPAVKLNLSGLEAPLPGDGRSLTFGGYLAIGGFDAFGLPTPMPSELGAPFAGQQLAGELSVTAAVGIGNVNGKLTLAGSYLPGDGVVDLPLSFSGVLGGELTFGEVAASGSFAIDMTWPLIVDYTGDSPQLEGELTVDRFAANDLSLTVPDLLELTIGSIAYADPAMLEPGDPIATMSDAALTFTSLPVDWGSVSVTLDAVAGYDDSGDGVIDGFGLSASIALNDVDLTIADRTLLTLAGLTLGVDGLQVRPERDDGFRTGELVFNATGLALLPGGLSGLVNGSAETPRVEGAAGEAGGAMEFEHPNIGSIDVGTGEFTLDLAVPAGISRYLTFGGFVPFQLVHLAGHYQKSDGDADVNFTVTGAPKVDLLVGKLGDAIGSPDLAVTLERYDADAAGWAAVTPDAPLSFGLTYAEGEFRPVGTPAVKLNLSGLEAPLPGEGQSLTFGGYVAVGGFDAFGLPTAMPAELGAPFAGQQLAGELTVTASVGIGNVNGTLTLAGSYLPGDGVVELPLSGLATLSGEVTIFATAASGSFTVEFDWPLVADFSGTEPAFSGAATVTRFAATDLTVTVPDIARFEIDAINYISDPYDGAPVASATGVSLTVLGVLGDAGVTGSGGLLLYDDDGNGLIDGLHVFDLTATVAAGSTWDYPTTGTPLLRLADLSVGFANFEYRPAFNAVNPGTGAITLAADQLALYPEGGGNFGGVVTDLTGSMNPSTGEVDLAVGSLTVGLGPGAFFQVELTDTQFRLDDDETTNLFSVAAAELRLQDGLDAMAAVTFGLTNFRFNLVGGEPRFGLDGVSLQAGGGVLASLGLAGVLPFDIHDLSLQFASTADGYTDFTQFTLNVTEGVFDLSLLDQITPFTPLLSIGGTPASDDDGDGQSNTFQNIELAFDVTAGQVRPVNLADLRLGFRDFAIGELVFAGEIVFDGFFDGELVPGVSGFVEIDTDSDANRVQPADGGSGVDLYGVRIDLAGLVEQTAQQTSLTLDAQAAVDFDLRLGDFLRLSDVAFNFGVDLTAPTDWRDDPLDRVQINPRLEQMAVGTLTASIGDYFTLGAVPGSGGGSGLIVDFAPDPGEPLARLNFNLASPMIGLSGTVNDLAILPGGVPDFAAIESVAIELVSRSDGSPSLLQDLFAEFLPLSVNGIELKFEDGFFAYETPAAPGDDPFTGVTGIADPTALNLLISGRAGTPDWLPDDFPMEIGSDFSELELSITKLLDGQFPFVSLAGLGFEAGIDFGAFAIGGRVSVGAVDADPTANEHPVCYLALRGEFEFSDFGASGAIAMTTAGPLGATLAVPLAIPIAQTGLLISGAAGSIQFGTVGLPAPEEIQRPADIGNIPNPFDIDIASPDLIRNVLQEKLWDETAQQVRPTWTQPVTLALQGELTHVAVAGMITGTATVAANLTLPIDGAPPDPGLALLGFGDVRALGLPFADAKLLFDLRDALNPSLGFYFQAPSNANPLGMLLPAQADFGVLLRTDGVLMATAVGFRSLLDGLIDGTLDRGQPFLDQVTDRMLDRLREDPAGTALAAPLAPLLPAGQTFDTLSPLAFRQLLRDSLLIDEVLDALGAGPGLDVGDIDPALQAELQTALDVATALLRDLTDVAGELLADAYDPDADLAQQLVDLGLRDAGQLSDPLDPLGLLNAFDPANLAFDRSVPLQFVSEFNAMLIDLLSTAVQQAIAETAAFVASDAFDPRLLVEGSFQPTLLGLPVGDPPLGVQLSVSKRGVSYGFDVSVIRTLQLASTLNMGPLSLLIAAAPTISDQTTVAYELPFNGLEALQDLAAGGFPLGAMNPFSPEWGMLALMQLSAPGFSSNASFVQFGPGSGLLENNVQIVAELDDSVDPGRIPVTSQQLLDRMLDLGGMLYTSNVTQSRLLTDPFFVVENILDAAEQAGEQFDGVESEIDYLFTLFETGPAFLEAIDAALTDQVEFARGQMYLPLSFRTLLPPELQALLDGGDTTAFNEAFEATFFDADGNLREDAVAAALQALSDRILDAGSTIAANMYLEGLINAKLFGIELGNGRLFAGVLPDPADPRQSVDFGNTAVTATGTIPWLGDLAIEAVIDHRPMTLPAPPVDGPDPLAALRAAFGDTVSVPRGRFTATLDTDAPRGETSAFERVLTSLGLDPAMFALPTVGSANASLSAYTPGYDLKSSDPLQRVGGLAFEANLALPGIVDQAAFTFHLSPPAPDGSGGTYVPFTGLAEVNALTLGGLTVRNAWLEVISNADGVRVTVQGDATVFGAEVTVDGTLNSDFVGELTLTLKTGEEMNLGGFDAGGALLLKINSPASGSIAFSGYLRNVPGLGSSVDAAGSLSTADGTFSLQIAASQITRYGFTLNNLDLELNRTSSLTRFDLDAVMTVLGVDFDVSGNLNTSMLGTLNMSLQSGESLAGLFGGFDASGSFELRLAGALDSEVRFVGAVVNLPGGFFNDLSVNGSINASDGFSVSGTVNDLIIAPNGVFIGSHELVIDASLTVSGNAASASISGSGSARVDRFTGFFYNPKTGLFERTSQTVIPAFTLTNFLVDTAGRISGRLDDLGFDSGILRFGAVSTEIQSDPTIGRFRLFIDEPFVEVDDLFGNGSPWLRTGSVIGDIYVDLTLAADIEQTIWSGFSDLGIGGFTLRKTRISFERLSSGTMRLILDDYGSSSANQSRVVLPGNLGQFELAGPLYIGTDGVFDVDLENLRIGPSAINVTADRLRFRKPTSSFYSLELRVENAELNLPFNKTVGLGTFAFNENADYTRNLYNLATSLLDFGSGFLPESDQTLLMDFRLTTTSSGWLFKKRDDGGYADNYIQLYLNPFSTAEIRSFQIDSNGNFSGAVFADLGILLGPINYNFASTTFSLSKSGSTVRLDVDDVSVNFGFDVLSVSGYWNSDGDYWFATDRFDVDERVTVTVGPWSYDIARVTGEFYARISSSSGFYARVRDARLEGRNFGNSTWFLVASLDWFYLDQFGLGDFGSYFIDW